MSNSPFYEGFTVGMLQDDGVTRRRVEKALADDGYELVMPPREPKLGQDEFLGSGAYWTQVSDSSYTKFQWGRSSYIVRRPSEHKRMLKFFFGRRDD